MNVLVCNLAFGHRYKEKILWFIVYSSLLLTGCNASLIRPDSPTPISKVGNCEAEMAARRGSLIGEPEEIKNYTELTYNVSEWIYSAHEVKYFFKWGPGIDGCYQRQEYVSELTEKGKQIRLSALKKEHPLWSEIACGAVLEKKVFIGMDEERLLLHGVNH
jgi:hypothetical protein